MIAETYEVLVDELTYASIAWEIHRGFLSAFTEAHNDTVPDESILPFLGSAVESNAALALCRLLDKHKKAAGFKSLLPMLPRPLKEQVKQELNGVKKERESVTWWRDNFVAYIGRRPRRQIARQGFDDPQHLFFLNGAPRILKAAQAALTQIADHYGQPAPTVDPPAHLAEQVNQFFQCWRKRRAI